MKKLDLILAGGPAAEGGGSEMSDWKIRPLKPGCGIYQLKLRVKANVWIERTSGCATRSEANLAAPAILESLRSEYFLAHPEEDPAVRAAADEVAAAAEVAAEASEADGAESGVAELGRGSTEGLLRRLLAARIKHRGLIRPGIYWSALKAMLDGLGDRRLLAPRAQAPANFARVRKFITANPRFKKCGVAYAERMRSLLELLIPHGLKESCIEELRNLPNRMVVEARIRKDEASGDPFSQANLRIILQREPDEPEPVRLVIWTDASACPQVTDIAFIPWYGIDLETGHICFRRVKTGGRVEFFALPPMLDLLRSRRERARPGAVYVFEDQIFTDDQRRERGCNQTLWGVGQGETHVPNKIYDRARRSIMDLSREFLRRCGIWCPELTNKSWRIHNLSLWAALGFPLKTRLTLAGHKDEENHLRYQRVTDSELMRVRDVMWKYFQAVREGRPFLIPSTPYDLYEALVKHWENFPEVMRHLVRDEFGGSFERLTRMMVDAFEAQRVHLKQQVEDLKRHGTEQRLLLEAKLSRSQDTLDLILAGVQRALPLSGQAQPPTADWEI